MSLYLNSIAAEKQGCRDPQTGSVQPLPG